MPHISQAFYNAMNIRSMVRTKANFINHTQNGAGGGTQAVIDFKCYVQVTSMLSIKHVRGILKYNYSNFSL